MTDQQKIYLIFAIINLLFALGLGIYFKEIISITPNSALVLLYLYWFANEE